MNCFPRRGIVDIRIFDRHNPSIIYHNNRFPNQIKNEDVANYNIKFNLFDIRNEKYIFRNLDYSDIHYFFTNNSISSKSLRLETVANLPVPIYTEETSKFRDIWEQLWK